MRGIIIDKDGTLFNYAYVWGPVVAGAVKAGFSELGVKGEKLEWLSLGFEKLFGVDDKGNNYKNGILFRPDLAPITIARMVLLSLKAGLNPFKVKNKVYSKIQMMGELIKGELEEKQFPGVRELFIKLKESGYVIGIVTNDSINTTAYFLEKMGLCEFVDFIRGAESGCRKKPHPDALNEFLKEFSLSADDVAVVGDTKSDMEFAKRGNAGYRVSVLTGSGDEKLLRRLSDAVYPTIQDLISDPVLFEKLS